MIYQIRHSVNQFDNQFGPAVAGRRFCPEDKGPRHHIQPRIYPKVIVKIDNVQDIEQLTFIFMQPLYLDIKNGMWINLYPQLLFYIGCQGVFLLLFDLVKRLLKPRIIYIGQ